jgi:hypothetical protein
MLPTIQRLAVAVFGLTFFAVACGPDEDQPLEPTPPRTITSDEALTTANRNLRAHLIGGARSGRVLSESELLGSLSDRATAPCPTEGPCEPAPDLELEAQATELADRMASLILNAGNLELAEPTRVVLRLKPEVACVDSSTQAGAIADDCRDIYSTTPVRLELSSRREGDVDVRLSIGDNVAGNIGLHQDELSIEIDLGAATAAYNRLVVAGGQQQEQVPGTFQGRIRLSLVLSAGDKAELSLSILSALIVDTNVEGERYRFELGAASPAFSAIFDASEPSLTLRTNNGGGRVLLPLAALATGTTVCTSGPDGEQVCERETPEVSGELEVRIPSSRGAVILGANDAVLFDLSLGDALRALHDGRGIFSLDLNPTRNRELHLELTPSEDVLRLQLAQPLSLIADFDLATLAETLNLPTMFGDETIRMDLDGVQAPAIEVNLGQSDAPRPGGEPAPSASLLKVIAGQMRMSARVANVQVTVSAGQCLNAGDATEGESSPLAGLEAGVCR